jgi:hypothetical protein
LLAKALEQSLLSRLKRRLREQAPSHSFCKAFCTDSLHSSAELEPPLVRHSTQFTVGGSLLAKALEQSLLSRLKRRLREQAPSHSFCKAFCTDSLHSTAEPEPPLVRHSTQFTVGGSLLAKALDQSLLSRLARRLREQAPSPKGPDLPSVLR